MKPRGRKVHAIRSSLANLHADFPLTPEIPVQRVRTELKKNENLCVAFGFTPRQLLELFFVKKFMEAGREIDREKLAKSDPKAFRWLTNIENGGAVRRYKKLSGGVKVISVPETMADWKNMVTNIPYKTIPFLSEKEVSYYREYANGNMKIDDLLVKFQITKDDIRELGNKIVERGIRTGLLLTHPQHRKTLGVHDRCNMVFTEGAPDGAEHGEEEYEKAESKAVLKGLSDLGTIHGKAGTQLKNFRTPEPRMTKGTSSAENRGAPARDDYGDESKP